MSCNYQITGVFSSLCRNGMRGHWAISRFLSCPRLSDNCSNESRGLQDWGQSENISLIFWTFQWLETTVADKIKLELIPRGSKYPIWPQLWIIPCHGHVPVTSRAWIHLPGGHLSHSQPPESQPLLRAPLFWAGGGDSSWHGLMDRLHYQRQSKQRGRQCWHGYAHQEKRPVHQYQGILVWPSDYIISLSLCCMMGCWRGGWGLDRAGVQDLIISDQVRERSWCWPIRSFP